MKAQLEEIGWVYVLELEELPYFKIGFTTDLGKRLADLATGLPVDIEVRTLIRATRSDEKLCHKLLKPWRKRGEWFHATATVTGFVEDLEDWSLYADMRAMQHRIRLGDLLNHYQLENCDTEMDMQRMAEIMEGRW